MAPSSNRLRAALAAWLSVAATGAMLALASVAAGCGKEAAPVEDKPVAAPRVEGETVVFAPERAPAQLRIVAAAPQASAALQVPGRLVWDEDRTARVYAPYGGRLERWRVNVGQAVARGAVLADVASADVGQAQADAQKARTDARLAQQALQRARTLAEGGVIARKELQQAEADAARAGADVTRTEARLATYGLSADRITQSLPLRAPLAGVVVERNATPGLEVRADVQGPPLAVVSDPSSLWAWLDVPETQLAMFQRGQPVRLRATAWPDEVFGATVLNVGEALDPATRTVKVRLRVPNAQRKLKAEMYVAAEVAHDTGGVIALPADAVMLRGDKTVLFVQKAAGRFERRTVEVKPLGPQRVAVVRGLAAGEQVVVGAELYLNQILDAAR